MLLGAVADDLTGATDLSLMLAREGMRTVQVIGIPQSRDLFGDADAVVVAMKSRTIPADEAVSQSIQAAQSLIDAGAEQLLFKYCSTFDSTPEGNIGPVAEALLRLSGSDITIACPALPQNNRTIYKGHLFVGDQLLSESSMKDHPLTPMRDPNLIRVLQAQTKLRVGLIPSDIVIRGAASIKSACHAAAASGQRILIVDALSDEHLRVIGEAMAGMRLITGGSGIAIGLPENFRRSGKLNRKTGIQPITAPDGAAIMLAGSCSAATRRQVDAAIRIGVPSLKLDPVHISMGRVSHDSVLAWIGSVQGIPLVYSSAEPEDVRKAQQRLGRDRAGDVMEGFLAKLARSLKARGFRQFVVAGGETSGAVVGALEVKALQIGQEIDPGVPWTKSVGDEEPLALALKSGNFGNDDFFTKAWERLR